MEILKTEWLNREVSVVWGFLALNCSSACRNHKSFRDSFCVCSPGSADSQILVFGCRPTVSEKVQGCTRRFMELLGYHSNLNPLSVLDNEWIARPMRRQEMEAFRSSIIRNFSTGISGGTGTFTSIWNLATVFLSEKWLSETYLS
jgi:hypothetical protein